MPLAAPALLLALAALVLLVQPAFAQREIASWGGAYRSMQQIAFVAPFNRGLTGPDRLRQQLRLVEHDGSLADLLNGDPPWYLIDLEAPEIVEGCRQGLLEKLDSRKLLRQETLLPDMTLDCGFANSAWSQLIAINKTGFGAGGPPVSLGDFFATDLFPGRRALPRRPEGLMELALLSMGVEPFRVYEQLSGDSGIERALARLNELGSSTVWFESANEGLALLRDNRAAAALLFHSQVLPLSKTQPGRYGMIFEGQLLERGFWAIPAGSPDRQESRELLAQAMSPEVAARMVQVNNYAPTVTEAFESIDPALAQLLPTHPEHLAKAFLLDRAWWRSPAGARAREAFSTWFQEIN